MRFILCVAMLAMIGCQYSQAAKTDLGKIGEPTARKVAEVEILNIEDGDDTVCLEHGDYGPREHCYSKKDLADTLTAKTTNTLILRRLEAIEIKLDRADKAAAVSTADRAEIVAYNECKSYCQKNYPWPWDKFKMGERSAEEKKAIEGSPAWEKAMDHAKLCDKKCDERKPKAQPDWSC